MLRWHWHEPSPTDELLLKSRELAKKWDSVLNTENRGPQDGVCTIILESQPKMLVDEKQTNR